MRLALAFCLGALSLVAAGPKPKVRIETSLGAFVVQLEPEGAPKTVANFLAYVRKGHYDGLIIHRVLAESIVQGGGHLPDLSKRPTDSAIPNESEMAKAKGLRNRRGGVAMALPVGNPFGATAQFFVNLRDNPSLDFKEKSLTGYGYCVFGKVTQGMDVLDRIGRLKTHKVREYPDVPVKAVIIHSAKEVK